MPGACPRPQRTDLGMSGRSTRSACQQPHEIQHLALKYGPQGQRTRFVQQLSAQLRPGSATQRYQAGVSTPSRRASVATSRREVVPVFRSRFDTWALTVFSLMNNSFAIST